MSNDQPASALPSISHRLVERAAEMGLTWTSDDQREKVEAVVRQMVEEAANLTTALRWVQAARVPLEDPAVGQRPSIKAVRDRLRRHSPTLGQDRQGATWARLIVELALDSFDRATAEPNVANLYTVFRLGLPMADHDPDSKEPTSLQREYNALWWGQSLYSKRRSASYRDLPADSLAWWMAEDLIDVMGSTPGPALTAYYLETLRKLCPDIDAPRSWETHARALLPTLAEADPLPADLQAVAAAEGTAIPLTWLVARGAARGPADCEALAATAGLPDEPLRGRDFAAQLFRERQLARIFAAG